MKIKVEIKRDNEVTHAAVFDSQMEVDAWIQSNEGIQSWGKLDRWVTADEEDITGHTDSEEVDVFGITVTRYFMPKVYTIEQSDITELFNINAESTEAKAYLASTDWYIIREFDSGAPCPQEIKDARALARSKVIN